MLNPLNPIRKIKVALWHRRQNFFLHIRQGICGMLTELRWLFPPAKLSHGLPAPLVVSLTSYPPRFGTLAKTLKCLLTQTTRADRIVLWIGYQDMELLPKAVTSLSAHGLDIRPTEDLKSYKKILPALDAFAGAYIATADDDIYYWKNWLKELIAEAGRHAKLIHCHRAHAVKQGPGGIYAPYEHWEHNTRVQAISPMLFPTGVGGVLYPPGILSHTPADRAAAHALCPNADDVWLHWMARRNGAAYHKAGHHTIIPWAGSQNTGLYVHNVLEGNNDRQIRRMAERYGYPLPISDSGV